MEMTTETERERERDDMEMTASRRAGIVQGYTTMLLCCGVLCYSSAVAGSFGHNGHLRATIITEGYTSRVTNRSPRMY